jgi:hypothetical protein
MSFSRAGLALSEIGLTFQNATTAERRASNLHHPISVRAELVEAPSFGGAKGKNGPSTSSGQTVHIFGLLL